MDAFFFQHSCGLNALPGGGNLDEHARGANALRFVQGDDAACTRHSGVLVKTQTRIDFGGDAARNVLQDVATKAHQEVVHLLVKWRARVLLQSLLQQSAVLGHEHGFQNQ